MKPFKIEQIIVDWEAESTSSSDIQSIDEGWLLQPSDHTLRIRLLMSEDFNKALEVLSSFLGKEVERVSDRFAHSDKSGISYYLYPLNCFTRLISDPVEARSVILMQRNPNGKKT